jgi:predicted protein tyrosine phosphatase
MTTNTRRQFYYIVAVNSCMDEIASGVYVTAIDTIRNTSLQDVDAIVTTCQDGIHDHVPDDCAYTHVNMADDRESADNWGGSYSFSTFREAADAVYRHLCDFGDSEGTSDSADSTTPLVESDDDIETIVVHCHRGRNRSVSVVTAALARYEDRPVSDVLFDVYDARDIIEPNDRMLWNAVTYVRIFS